MIRHTPPLCRGLTLIEALLALVLLGSVLAAGNAWVRMTSRASKDIGQRTEWRTSTEAFLQLIHDELAEYEPGALDENELPAIWTDERLAIATRDMEHGVVFHQYRLDQQRGFIFAQVSDIEGKSIGHENANDVLLAGVAAFDCSIDEDARLLTVTIRSADDQLVHRDYRLP